MFRHEFGHLRRQYHFREYYHSRIMVALPQSEFEEGESFIGKSPISDATAGSLRNQFNIKSGQPTVILVGKDGGEKPRSTGYVPIEDIFSLIDAMPMRQAEMRERRERK